MGRLTGKNILMIIPKDYYKEDELEIPLEIFKKEGAKVLIASAKLKEAIGMKTGRVTPNLLIVDSVEGITGDSYVTETGSGHRQIKGVFHGIVIVGGSGAKKYLWPDRVLKLMLADRHRSGFVVAAIGLAVPCLADLLDGKSVAAEINKDTEPLLNEAKAVFTDEEVVSEDNIITAKGVAAAEKFALAIVEAVEKTKLK